MEGSLKQIKGLGKATIELLNTVGVEDVGALAQSDPSSLRGEIQRANGLLKVLKRIPTEKRITSWVEKAQEMAEVIPEVQEVLEVPEESQVPEELEMPTLDALPVAIAMRKEQIINNKIAVQDVPVMDEFVDFKDEIVEIEEVEIEEIEPEEVELERGDFSTRKKKKRKSRKKRHEQAQASGMAPSGYSGESSLGARAGKDPLLKIDPLNMRGEGEGHSPRPVVEPLKRNTGFDIRKTASPQLNEGRKLHSRRYIRGVLSPQPKRVRIAALITAITLLLFPASVLAGGLVIFREPLGLENALMFLIVPVVFLFFAFLYLTIARPMKCRICGQPLLSRKDCFKHVKAHRIPLLGYLLSTSLHILLFHWFRCIYCGTSVRLKE